MDSEFLIPKNTGDDSEFLIPKQHRRFRISDPPNNTKEDSECFFFGSGGVGGGRGGEQQQKYRLLINVGFLKPAILCSKALLVLRSRLELGIVSHKVFFLFLPEIFICSFNNNEVGNAPMAKLLYHAAGSAQFFAIII